MNENTDTFENLKNSQSLRLEIVKVLAKESNFADMNELISDAKLIEGYILQTNCSSSCAVNKSGTNGTGRVLIMKIDLSAGAYQVKQFRHKIIQSLIHAGCETSSSIIEKATKLEGFVIISTYPSIAEPPEDGRPHVDPLVRRKFRMDTVESLLKTKMTDVPAIMDTTLKLEEFALKYPYD